MPCKKTTGHHDNDITHDHTASFSFVLQGHLSILEVKWFRCRRDDSRWEKWTRLRLFIAVHTDSLAYRFLPQLLLSMTCDKSVLGTCLKGSNVIQMASWLGACDGYYLGYRRVFEKAGVHVVKSVRCPKIEAKSTNSPALTIATFYICTCNR